MELIRSPRLITCAVLLCVFGLGALTGWTLGARWGEPKFSPFTNLATELKRDELTKRAIRGMSELELSPEQIEKLHPIIDSAAEELVRLRKECLKKMIHYRIDIIGRFGEVLTPEQKTKLQDMMHKRNEELEKLMKDDQPSGMVR